MSTSQSTTQTRFQIIRNITVFTAAALGGGYLGVLLDQTLPSPDPTQRLGALLWLVTPLLTVVLLRAFGGDGWNDFGLWPRLRFGWQWYLLAAAVIPLVTVTTLLVGFGVGGLTWIGLEVSALLRVIGTGLAAVLVKNIFEEFAWRGYLVPRFAALELHPLLNHVLTGLIWAAWHIPYLLFFLRPADLEPFTNLSTPAFIALAFLLLPAQSVFYGELRLLSNSVWTAWWLHTLANALALPLVAYGFRAVHTQWIDILSPGTNGIIYSGLLLLIGLGLYRYRTRPSVADPKPSLANVTG
jgi:membrane protease YdiL (CAAX protease family)